MDVAETWKIEACLSLVREVELGNLVISGRGDPESKTSRCLREHGYTASDVLDVLHGLHTEDYSQGPMEDNKGRPHDLWVFGKTIADVQLYIKFTVFYEGESIVGICVSFHEAERDMEFPYGKGAR